MDSLRFTLTSSRTILEVESLFPGKPNPTLVDSTSENLIHFWHVHRSRSHVGCSCVYSIPLWRTAAGLFGHRHGSLAKANCLRDSRLTAIGCPTSSYLLLAVETTNLAQLTIDFAETQRPTGKLENVSCHFMPFHAQKPLSVTASSSDSIATPLRLQAHGEDVQAVRLWGSAKSLDERRSLRRCHWWFTVPHDGMKTHAVCIALSSWYIPNLNTFPSPQLGWLLIAAVNMWPSFFVPGISGFYMQIIANHCKFQVRTSLPHKHVFRTKNVQHLELISQRQRF